MIKIFCILLFVLITVGQSLAFDKINLSSNCGKSTCQFLEKRILKVLQEANDTENMYKGLRFALNDGLIKKFSFSYKIVDRQIWFEFNSSLNSFLQDISFISKQTLLEDRSLQNQINNLKIPYVGSVYNDVLENQVVNKVKTVFMDSGYLDVSIRVSKRIVNNRVFLEIFADQKDQYLIKDIEVNCELSKKCENDLLLKPVIDLIGSPWKKVEFINKLNMVENKKRKKRFYNFSAKLNDVRFENSGISIKVRINKGIGHNFFISGNEKISKIELLNYVKNKIYDEKIRIDANELKSILRNYLAKYGYYSASVKVNDVRGFNKNRNPIINHFIKIKEKSHTRVSKIYVSGVSDLINKKILELISQNQSSFHLKGYFLESDFMSYNKIISEFLASSGYFFSEVSGPYLSFSDDKSNVDINFKVSLGKKVEVKKIDYGFPETLLSADDLKRLKNRVGGVYYAKNLKDDKEYIINRLKNNGYYFARFGKNNQRSEYFVENSQKVILKYNIIPGEIIKIGKIEVVGLNKTKKEIIFREISVKTGDLLSPDAVNMVNDEIVPLNLFSFVNVKPSKVYTDENGDHVSDLVIQLNERDYGLIRLSPGYRTDLGFKVESLFQRNNIGGRNEAFSLNLRGNRRTSLSYLDSRRQNESNNLLEFAGVTSYSIPYILNNEIRLQTNAEVVRRRFYGFDADIARLSFRLNKNFSDIFGTSFRYQFENIKQYDATQDSDSGYFRIGSLMSSVFIDLRNRVVNPSSGSYHGLSFEIGNPTLLSMKDSNLEINFLKIVSRNRMYFDLDGLTLAASFTAGFQKNLANDVLKNDDGTIVYNEDGSVRTVGILPSIKVFRLEGVDGVRGFSEEEINRLDDGMDILDKRIQNTSYLINSKIELRKMLSDSIIGALFFDAGKLYVNSFKPLKLRRSAGVSFKLLTPVGTLDFDYGLKLDRKTNARGQSEMFGRFHLAIGFF